MFLFKSIGVNCTKWRGTAPLSYTPCINHATSATNHATMLQIMHLIAHTYQPHLLN